MGKQHHVPLAGSSDKILKIPLLNTTTALSLQQLVQQAFFPVKQQDGRRCSNCMQNDPGTPMMPTLEKTNLSMYPPYLFIQLLRMEYEQEKPGILGSTVKNCTPISLEAEILVDQQKYELIGLVTHMGTANAGHNRAYLQKESHWYLCEDDKQPRAKIPNDNPSEQSYCLLLKRRSKENDPSFRQSLTTPNPTMARADKDACNIQVQASQNVVEDGS